MTPQFTRSATLASPIAAALLLVPGLALSAPIPEIAPEIVSAWKLNAGNLVVIFRHDGVFYIIDGDGGGSGQPGMERGTFEWDKTSGVFSANVAVDSNGEGGFSNPNGGTSITVSGNTLTYNVTEEGSFPFTRIVNTPSAIVGSWHLPGQDANLTFLADGTYYHSQESNNEPDSTTGMERGTYTWNSATGAFSGNPITDTNGDIGLSDPGLNPNTVFITGSTMTLYDGEQTYTARRITPIVSPLDTENDFEVDKFANYLQASAAPPTLWPVPVPSGGDYPFWGEAYIEDTVSGTGGTMTITGQAARPFVDDGGWSIADEYSSLALLNASTAFPNGSNYIFSRAGGSATLSYPSNGAFPPAPVIIGGENAGTWSNGVYALGKNQTLTWSAHTAYDPATLLTILSVVDQETAEELLYETVLQGDIVSYDFRGKLTPGRSYDVQLEHVKIAGSTASGTGPFAGKLGYAFYNSNTRFTMVVPDVELLVAWKQKISEQQSSSLLIPIGAAFSAGIEGNGINATFPSSGITLTKPDNSIIPFVLDGNRWDSGADFSSFATLQNAFPDGTYRINIGNDSIPIDVYGSNYPNQPLVTASAGTWVNGKLQISASQAATGFTLASNSSSGDGLETLSVIDVSSDEDIVTSTSVEPSVSIATTISPNLLAIGKSYEVEVEFDEVVDFEAIAEKPWGQNAKAFGLLSTTTVFTIEVVADPTGNPYISWQAGFFSPAQLANLSISGDLADFDKDGIPNLLEYLLGGNPTLPSSGLLPAITKAPGSTNVVFTYQRKIAATGVTQVIEHATSLSPPWTPAVHGAGGVTIVTAPVPGDATSEQVTVTIPSTGTSRFVRLKAGR